MKQNIITMLPIKKHVIPLLLIFFVFLKLSTLQSQNLYINEVMASNQNVIADEDGSYEDWIEIYNMGDQAINLEGYGLSDNYDQPFKWVFPDYIIDPGEYLLVWASGKDRKPQKDAMTNGIKRLYYPGISGTSVDDLLNHPSFPDYPSSQNIINNYFEAPTNIAENYGQHLYTWIKPPITGEYTFWISSDDNSRLFLSTDSLEQNATLIAEVTGWTPPREWNKYPEQQSVNIFLEEGNLYYLSALMKEGLGGDNLAVRWQWPDGTMDEPLNASYCFIPTSRLHTNFKISASGEEIILTDSTGVRIDEMPPTHIPANITFGRSPDGSADWKYFNSPTPEGPNHPEGFAGISGKPGISPSGGIFHEPVIVSMVSEDENASVYYTLNGSTPGMDNGILYQEPFTLNNTTYVRAIEISPGSLPGEITAATYSIANGNIKDFSSNLPMMIIHQFDTLISVSDRTSAYMFIVDNEHEEISDLLAEPVFDGRIKINYRGSSSLSFPKKGFGFHTLEENGSNRKVSLLGMPEEHNWILHGPYSDKSLMRNAISYALSNDLGRYSPRTRFVELFLHDGEGSLSQAHYQGVYLLVERIKIAPGRVEIEDLETYHNEYPEISGGYIFKKDRLNPGELGFTTNRGSLYAHVRPNEQTITEQQKDYLISFLDSLEQVLFSSQFDDPELGYAAYLDVGSFIDMHLLTELCKEIDGYRLSTFFYKDRGGKLNLGPLWDFNLSLGNANYLEGWKPEGWYYPLINQYDYLNGWFTQLFKDKEFKKKYKKRYRSLRTGAFSNAHITGKIMDYYQYLSNAQVRNFKKWDILGKYIWPNWYVANTYEEEILWMIDWINKRLAWMDSQLGAPFTLIHYWNFNQEDNYLIPTYTLANASIGITKGLNTEITTGSGQGFTGANARNNDETGFHLRVNNPIGTELLFKLPANNFQNLIFSYETRRSNNGANRQYISYTIDGETFNPLDTLKVSDNPLTYWFDFDTIPQVNNNSLFSIKVIIDYINDGTGGTLGNNRFDNVILEGEPMEGVNLPPIQTAHFPDPFEVIEGQESTSVDLSDFFNDPDDDTLEYILEMEQPDVANLEVNSNKLTITPVKRGGSKVNVSVYDGTNPPINTTFYLLVYPKSIKPDTVGLVFDYWDPNEPEGNFPSNMLFLQSKQNDPTPASEFTIAYSIPDDDYAEEDLENLGFPYKNQRRTRINGLNSNGISFINTGRGRDVGAALVAINTQELERGYLSWKASTIRANSRVYHIRLQYRVGIDSSWENWKDEAGQPIEYKRSSIEGHSFLFENLELPHKILHHPYIQLRFLYYFTGQVISQTDGSRDMLALNHVSIQDIPTTITPLNRTDQLLTIFPNPANQETVYLNYKTSGYIMDINGNIVATVKNSKKINANNLAPGIYLFTSIDGSIARFIISN